MRGRVPYGGGVRMLMEGLDHPKTLDFAARLDVSIPQVIGHLELLWAFVAKKTPHGNIGKWPDGTIARAAQWTGDPGVFVAALHEAGFIDDCATHRFVIHDWADHAPRWVRSKLSRAGETFAKRECTRECSRDCTVDSKPSQAKPGISSSDEEESPAVPDDAIGGRDGSPSRKAPPCPADLIVGEYHRLLPELPVVAKLTSSRRKALQARWREREGHQSLDFWRWYFGEVVRGQAFLMGENDRGWRADFEFLVKESSFYKTVESKYAA